MEESSKISEEFIISQYQSGVHSYSNFTREVGLWESEKYVFFKYLNHSHVIADIGCGTGRTTIPLFQNGFHNVTGTDLTPEMIDEARIIQRSMNLDIQFKVGNALQLDFTNESCDAAIFSFNGLMSIPSRERRLKAVLEINRILKPGSIFIFTTHDRDREPQYFEMWESEKSKWMKGNQDPALHEFGDILAYSKNETSQIFIHIPNQEEVITLLQDAGFDIVETFYRSDLFEESAAVKEKSGECRFWIARKSMS